MINSTGLLGSQAAVADPANAATAAVPAAIEAITLLVVDFCI
jgi:hypothetical protein